MAMKRKDVSPRRARLEEIYVTKIRPSLKQNLQLGNIMQVPKVSKVVINVGAKEAVADSKVLQTVTFKESRLVLMVEVGITLV